MNTKSFRPGTDIEIRIHDGIVGAIILLSVVLGMMVNPIWFWLAGLTAAVMFSSAFTGFCPVHYVLCKIYPITPDKDSTS
ncbi:YgaP family membrane protein [Parasedimentitalea psychrophila]|uniref:DUF2892 domain-containing protein n=1 Tax=Parasedimentitalea psychrophila TaxID=2997337 RepID=A0A9Y2KWL4_9RHOB|nr:DUF2892 domain-containing protein [Parasedimentitalea psychrophila]WIY23888.1 DUF2892 domain-containing protein [Parasedimentitalea psychrophila]